MYIQQEKLLHTLLLLHTFLRKSWKVFIVCIGSKGGLLTLKAGTG